MSRQKQAEARRHQEMVIRPKGRLAADSQKGVCLSDEEPGEEVLRGLPSRIVQPQLARGRGKSRKTV